MTKEEWEKIPIERRRRFWNAIRDLRRNCLDCQENLTLEERRENRAYCKNCWKEEPNEPDDGKGYEKCK